MATNTMHAVHSNYYVTSNSGNCLLFDGVLIFGPIINDQLLRTSQ
jgi:hypothetical protein